MQRHIIALALVCKVTTTSAFLVHSWRVITAKLSTHERARYGLDTGWKRAGNGPGTCKEGTRNAPVAPII